MPKIVKMYLNGKVSLICWRRNDTEFQTLCICRNCN